MNHFMNTTTTTIIPPSTQSTGFWRGYHRAMANACAAASITCSLSASLLMLGSAGLACLAEEAALIGDRLRDRGFGFLTLCHPVAALSLRAREDFFARRDQGQALD